MTFTTEQVNTNGAYQQGQIATDYGTLVDTFGLPAIGPTFESSDNKVTCMWTIQFEDGTVATIYDWDTITTPLHLHSWLVGGYIPAAVDKVLAVLEGKPVKTNVNDKIISIVEVGLTKLKDSKTPLETADCLNSLGDILKYQARKLLV